MDDHHAGRMDYQVIGRFLRGERERLGITQTELAKLARVHYNTVQRVELGKGLRLSFESLAKICTVLNVSLDWIAEGGDW
jgi:transcriptional regulator with XRE-family HTH domain